MALMAMVLVFSMASAGVSAEEKNLVRAIVVKGNSIIDTETIKGAILKTKLNEPAVEQKILDDLRSIYDLGYFQDASASFDPALGGGVQVVFHVVENPLVQDVSFSGLTQVPLGEYKKKMKTQAGYILNVHDLWEDLKELREWIGSEYGFVVRVADLQADTDGRIHIELAQTTLKDIVIEGNNKTKDFVIEREFTFKPGDPVNVREIDQSLRKVLMLGFFDEISRDFSEEDNPDETVLTINLNERKTGSATFGVAYSSNDGLVGFVEAADDNFFGRGQRVNATVQLGKKVHAYELGFYEPYIDKSGTSLGLNLYRRGKDVEKEDNKGKRITNGGDLTLGRPFGDFSRGRLVLKMENNKYDLESGSGADWYKDYNNRTIGFGFGTNTSDHPFFPTEGQKSDAYLELGTSLFGGNSQYAKLRAEYSKYFEVKDGGYVLALRGLGGRLLAGELQENEKFVIGGAETLRGYSPGGNGAIDLEGDHMLVMNAEFRFPIVDKVTGVLFTDWGKTWDQGEGFTLSDLNNSFGLGVRLDTPLGLLRLDYGLGKDENLARKGQFYFGIGQTF
jgi:outer membrane protein insertion porin family